MYNFIRNNTFKTIAGIWIVITSIHFSVLLFINDIDFLPSFADAVIYNFLTILTAAGLWYMVKYTGHSNELIFNKIYHFLTGIIIATLFWLFSGYFILDLFLSDYSDYINLLKNSLLFRGIIGVFNGIALTLIYIMIIRTREHTAALLREKELENSIRKAELDLLRSQIKPHFLFNALNSVNSLTLSDSLKARDMIVKLSEYFRFSLGIKDEQMISFSEEIYYSKLYLEIEKVRFGDKLNIEYHISDNSTEKKIPAMILQPVIENAVKFSTYDSLNQAQINISTEFSDNILIVSIKNSYEDDTIVRKGTGTGLVNTMKRLKLLYGSENLIKITKKDSVFELLLHIPQTK
ncbi:MAG: histidine kinase [Bacteroidota bacterium]